MKSLLFNLGIIPHDIVKDSVVKWAGLILSERVPFNLDEVSVEDAVGIRLCGDSNWWETPFAEFKATKNRHV